jgi:hypothetical protein
MRLGELASLQSWLSQHPLARDPIWAREALAVNEMEIQLFYARAGMDGLRTEAIDAIDTLQAAVITAAFKGELAEIPAAIVLHELPEEPFLVDDLVDGLEKLNPSRRTACLFALESHRSAKFVAELTWKDAICLKQLPKTCSEILQKASRTRHMRLPYVFWEWATPTIAAPLLEFSWSVEQAFGCTWPELQARHGRMIRVSSRADASDLLELVKRH